MHTFYFQQTVLDEFDIFSVVNAHINSAYNDSVVALQRYLAHIHTQLVGNYFRYIEQYASAVYASQFYCSIEEQFLVHIPLCIENARTEARFQFCSHWARTVVDFDVGVVVDKAHSVVAWNNVAATWEDVSSNVVLVYEDWFLLVQVFINND